jgi:hypothetical protein
VTAAVHSFDFFCCSQERNDKLPIQPSAGQCSSTSKLQSDVSLLPADPPSHNSESTVTVEKYQAGFDEQRPIEFTSPQKVPAETKIGHWLPPSRLLVPKVGRVIRKLGRKHQGPSSFLSNGLKVQRARLAIEEKRLAVAKRMAAAMHAIQHDLRLLRQGYFAAHDLQIDDDDIYRLPVM